MKSLWCAAKDFNVKRTVIGQRIALKLLLPSAI